MPIVTLTSDLGSSDHYVAVFKGKVLGKHPLTPLVDISHQIPSFDLHKAADVVFEVIPSFPEGTLHILAVCPDPVIKTGILVIPYKGQWLIGPDNGIFSTFFVHENPSEVFQFKSVLLSESTNPLGEDFALLVNYFLDKAPFENFLEPGKLSNRMPLFLPIIESDLIRCHIRHIDKFENLITNLHRNDFERVWNLRPFEILFKRRKHSIDAIEKNYNAVAKGDFVAFFNSSGYLEIAINHGNAAGLLNLTRNDELTIIFQ